MGKSDVRTLFWEAEDLKGTDPDGALARFGAAAEAGDLDAKFQLAIVLSDSDPKTAIQLFEELDDADFDCAAWHLAQLLWDSDRASAWRWYRRAASRDDVAGGFAALWLGQHLVYTERRDEAAVWLQKAQAAGVEGVAIWLGWAVEGHDKGRALELYREAIRDGNKSGYRSAGNVLEQSGDIAGARQHYEAGVDRGDKAAMVGLFRVTPWTKPAKKLRLLLRFPQSFERQYRQMSEIDRSREEQQPPSWYAR